MPEPSDTLSPTGRTPVRQRVIVVGAGWAGCAAAVEACRRGHAVTLLEASHAPGGRARALPASPVGPRATHSDVPTLDTPLAQALSPTHTPSPPPEMVLDNGQHILIGAYTETLALMASLGVNLQDALLRLPLQLPAPDGLGLILPAGPWPPTLAVAKGLLGNREWSWLDRLRFMAVALGWQLRGFRCPADWTVDHLCRHLPASVIREMIEPLCVSALNTPAHRASAQVLLRVLHDALFAAPGGSDLLIPRQDLSALLPRPALKWLQAQGADIQLGQRVTQLQASNRTGSPPSWRAITHTGASHEADALLLAVPHAMAARLLRQMPEAPDDSALQAWLNTADALQDEAIATVYARAWKGHTPMRLPAPMLRLRGAPAQFVFDRGQLQADSPAAQGWLAFVISATDMRSPNTPWPDAATLEQVTLAQAHQELGQLGLERLEVWRTVVEKRATFACSPGLQRPAMRVSPALQSLWVCGDHVDGPYPATLESAVRSGLAAARQLTDLSPRS